jgi:hypothetical protein
MICVGLLTTIRISGTAAFRGWVVVDAALGFGVAGLELVGAPCDSDWVSALGVTVLGVWDSEPVVPVLGVWDWEPVVPVLGVWDSEPVWALAAKASIAPRAATLSKRQCLRKADRRI